MDRHDRRLVRGGSKTKEVKTPDEDRLAVINTSGGKQETILRLRDGQYSAWSTITGQLLNLSTDAIRALWAQATPCPNAAQILRDASVRNRRR